MGASVLWHQAPSRSIFRLFVSTKYIGVAVNVLGLDDLVLVVPSLYVVHLDAIRSPSADHRVDYGTSFFSD